jgi:AsmA family/AsmA-like C-terminal region
VQTTLLGLAIAIILALVAALVGPHFVDWGRYRTEFETNASRLVGMQVRAAGPIELRLLPTPALTLEQFEVSRPGDAGAVRARKLSVEFELGALVRGEWRAANVRLEGVDFALALDDSGRLDWPAPTIGKEAEALSIQRLDIVDGRALLADSASGSHVLLEKLEFQGELRSLVGPLKGEGSFALGGQNYPYRISAGRVGDDGTMRLHLNVDPGDRPLSADADGTISIERGVPRFEGTLALAQPVRPAPAGTSALIIEPWRLTSKFKGDSTAALIEQIEFQYGPDDRAVKLRGDAKLSFGQHPQLEGVLSSPQIDLDRLLALPEATRRRPLVALKAFADSFAGVQRPPVPVKLGITVETVTLAGAMLQRVTSDLRSDAATWDIESLNFRAPGATQVGLSGRLALSPKGVTFTGPAKIEARDPRALAAWLTDRADTQTSGPLRAEGEVAFGDGALVIERLKAEVDRMSIAGRLAYSSRSGDRPARIEAALSTPDIDLDRALSLAQGALADTGFELPREGALALKLGRATVAGVEARRADVSVQFNAKGLAIEQFSIGDFGGAALRAQGRIDAHLSSPHGTVTFDLDARALDGVAAMLEKLSPAAAAQLRRGAARLVPAKLRAALAINADASAPGAPPLATFVIEGSAGTFKINLQGDAGSAGENTTIADLAHLIAGKINLAGRLESTDGAALVEFLALDRLVAVDKRPGRLNFTVSGAITGDLALDGQIVAGGLDAAARGSLRIAGHERPIGNLELRIGNANVRLPRTLAGARLGDTVSTQLTARLALSEAGIEMTDVTGKIAGSDVKGRLAIGLAATTSVDGEIELGFINLPATFGAAIGAPAAGGGAVWPAEPFEPGIVGSLTGQVAIKSARVAFTPKLAARDVRAVLLLGPSEIALQKLDGGLAGGRVTGDLAFERNTDGIFARGHVRVAVADIAELIPGDGRPPMSGRLTVELALAGTGRSPVALMGSLAGGGSFRWQDGRVLRLDPIAFEAVARGIDLGLALDAIRVHDRMELALGNGGLNIPLAEGDVTLSNGLLRLANPTLSAQGADLVPNGSIDLAESTIDARLVLSGPEIAGAPAGTRPEIAILLKGPVDAPRRTLEVASFASWLALRAVEQQAKRIDVLEAGGNLPVDPVARIAPAPIIPPVTVAPVQQPALATPRPISRSVPDVPTGQIRQRPPAVPAAPPSPPPLDIRPAQR